MKYLTLLDPGALSLMDVFEKSVVGTPSLTSITVLNSDGTRTVISGSNLQFEGNVGVSGAISSITRTNAAGTITYETMTGFGQASSFASLWNRDTNTSRFQYVFSQDDEIKGSTGDDSLFGGAGGDQILGGEGDDTLSGGNGADLLNDNGVLSVQGHWINTGGEDVLKGNAGNDRVVSSGGIDVIDGGADFDVLAFDRTNVTADLAFLARTFGSFTVGGDGSTIKNIEEFSIYSGSGNDTIRTLAGDDDIWGGAGNDRIYAGAGNDTLRDGSGSDILNGGDGQDQFSLDSFLENDRVDGGAGVDRLNYFHSDLSNQLVFDASQAMFTVGATRITNVETFLINGGVMNDVITTSAGDDVLLGFDGDDVLDGGAGADLIDGGEGTDTASYFSAASGAVIDLTEYSQAGAAAGDILWSIEIIHGSDSASDVMSGDTLNNVFFGFGGDDYLFGREGQDLLIGGVGNDELVGGDDNDILNGGAGADNISGGAGQDTASYADSAEAVRVGLSTNLVPAGGDAEGDILSGIEILIGSNHNDLLAGDRFSNVLVGEAGSDRLNGGRDADILIGGAGSDRFVFAFGQTRSHTSMIDVVFDYETGAVGSGDILDTVTAMQFVGIGGDAAANTDEASINSMIGVVSFAAGSGTTGADALGDITRRMTAAGDSAGEFAFFQVNNTGNFYLFVSDGVAGASMNDILVELNGLQSINEIDISRGDVTILA